MSHSFVITSHFLRGGASPWDNYNFLEWQAGRSMESHAHGFLQTIHVLEGTLEVDCGAGWRKFRPDDAHVLPPGRPHRMRTQTGHRQFGLNFAVEKDGRGLLEALLGTFKEPLALAMPFRQAWVAALQIRAGHGGALGWLRQLHALEDYSLALLETATPRQELSLADTLVERLEAGAAGPFSVPGAAAALHCGRATLQRLCKRRFGCGVAQLRERLRLEKAAGLLLRDNASVGEVASACGYADIYGFSRSFKRVFGLSPLAFRRRTDSMS